ncbi:Six-hairpin glycosidase-like protein [Auriculariales sp. MPI-PUGE-AT-0066]|nr:Six-hairpin glycosidase-like protein [Auriculariales sp. MPI-PUGE-AT-0066]
MDAQTVLQNAMATPDRMTQYQTAGSLLINMTQPELAQNVTTFERALEMNTAIATTSYTLNDVEYIRTAFVSGPSGVLVAKMNASAPGALNFTVSLRSPLPISKLTVSDGEVVLDGQNTVAQNGLPGVMTYQVRAKVHASGGTVQAVSATGEIEAHLIINAADEIIIVLGVTTSFVGYDDGSSANPAAQMSTIFSALPTSNLFDTLLASHIASHQTYFDRFSVDTGNVAQYSSLPTDARIQRGRSGGDPGIISLYINFARYLLISSSQKGSRQPANLQGIWQHDVNTAWQSKFTTNINVEQNYWPAQVMSLDDTIEPLVKLLEDVAVTGQHTAQVMYNTSTQASTPNGGIPWVMHHNTDQWRATAPVDNAFYGFWPTGGAWVLQTIYEHMLFDPSDIAFARRVYPLFQGAAQFFLETLQPHPNNTDWLVTNPSLSPEKAHHDSVSITMGPTLDNSLLRDLFSSTSSLAELLDIDVAFRTKLAETSEKLPPFMITSAGALQEWIEDYEPQPPAFSHISPMYPLYPSAQIDTRLNATLAEAARTYLTYRGDGSFGWPVAWRVGTWARLLDGEHVYTEIKLLTSGSCAWPSLMGKNSVARQSKSIDIPKLTPSIFKLQFQIDANLGGGGAMIEMFVQSHNSEIHLLPALPQILESGSVRGVRARGGFVITLSWQNNSLTEATFVATNARATSTVRLQRGTKTVTLDVAVGQSKKLTASDFA